MEFLDQLKNLKEQLKFESSFGSVRPFSNIIISGMGGSGIAGSIFSELYDRSPVTVVSDYNLPAYAGPDTLFIGISYSGNTEETLTATREAVRKGCQIRLITSGGELSELGEKTVIIPSGLQPRSALGYLLVPFLRSFMNFNESDYEETCRILSGLDAEHREARELAETIGREGSIPVIFGHYPYRWVAYRWKTQFNENSKILAFSNFFPELNHNDTVPLKSTYRKDAFRFISFGDASDRIEKRIEITSRITGTDFVRVHVNGKTLLQKLFYLIHYGDYVSYHLAKYRNIDPEEVSVISSLKDELMH